MDSVWDAVKSNLGNSSHTSAPAEINGFRLPEIPEGAGTTVIPVVFPVTTPGPSAPTKAIEEMQVMVVIVFAGMIWTLPWICINRQLCCSAARRCLSRHLGAYFMAGLVVNLILVSIVIASAPSVSANGLFFAGVTLIEIVSDKLEEVLTQVAILAAVFVVITFRRRIVALLGFDTQLVRADLRDVLTCFTMNRFHTVEVAVWKMEGLPAGISTRSLFVRVVLGYNEAQHTRPHDACSTSLLLRERIQLNYDPEDDTQKLSLVVKQQEVVGVAVSQLAPGLGALVGAAGGMVTPMGPTVGAGLGVVTGVGAANSLGVEVARVDLSAAMINRLRKGSNDQVRQAPSMSTGPLVPWREEHFFPVDLVPQGVCYLRITDLPDP